MHVSLDDPRIAVVAAALEPFQWQRLHAEMLARYVVAALDRHWLSGELASVLHAAEMTGPLEPAGADDERVGVVAQALSECRWRRLTAAAVGAQAIRAVETWQAQQRWLDVERSWRLGDSM